MINIKSEFTFAKTYLSDIIRNFHCKSWTETAIYIFKKLEYIMANDK